MSSTPGSDKASLKSSRPPGLKRLMAHGAVGAALLATWASAPAQALTWNWSFDAAPQFSAQGTFTTAGSTALANTMETIIDITGTFTEANITFNITGLDSFASADNQFKWDGSNASPIIANNNGISFVLDYLVKKNIFYFNFTDGIYGAIDGVFDGVIITAINSSSLSPVPAPTSVPSPLPLFGAAAGFGWSRQLRRRIKPSV